MLRLSSVYISQKLLCVNGAYEKIAKSKFSRCAHTLMNVPFGSGLMHNLNKQSKIYGVCLTRYESTVNAVVKETASSTNSDLHLQGTEKIKDVNNVVPESDLISEIPEPPVPPSVTEEIVETIVLHANGEPTFSSIGLGGYGPIGLLQYYLEWVHISFDMPWWAVIVLTSFIIKVVTIPLAVDQQRNMNRMQNFLPQIIRLQTKVSDARLSGNVEESTLCAYELQELMSKNKIKLLPMSAYMRTAIHFPVFLALRQMIAHPVESMKEGGLFWFKDLTVPDPYYVLPVIASSTLFLVTEHSFRNSAGMNMSQTMRYVVRGLPLLSFLFSMHFGGAVLCHWIVSNIMTVSQSMMLRNRKVQEYFNIPPTIEHKDNNILKQRKNFKEALLESWSNMRTSNKLANHVHTDVRQFNEAGRGPLKRTYKYNPVKDPRHATAVSAMKK